MAFLELSIHSITGNPWADALALAEAGAPAALVIVDGEPPATVVRSRAASEGVVSLVEIIPNGVMPTRVWSIKKCMAALSFMVVVIDCCIIGVWTQLYYWCLYRHWWTQLDPTADGA